MSRRSARDATSVSTFRASAWAPYEGPSPASASELTAQRDWLRHRDDLACRWVLDRAGEEGARPVLRVMSHARHYYDADNPFSPVARAGTVVTHSSGHAHGPTLVPWANATTAVDGLVGARQSSILLHEGPSLPLIGWAMHLGALNLRTLRPEPDIRSPEQVRLIRELAPLLVTSRSSVSRRRAATVVGELVESGLGWAVLVGSLLAVAPRLDLEALEKIMPPVWRDEADARRHGGVRR